MKRTALALALTALLLLLPSALASHTPAPSAVTIAGSLQSELGCSGDWQPDCLRSWLQDPDEDGTYTFVSGSIPAGTYEAKVAINESWDENYGRTPVSPASRRQASPTWRWSRARRTSTSSAPSTRRSTARATRPRSRLGRS